MPDTLINVRVFRFDPSIDQEPHYESYEVPLRPGMSVLDALDYIYEELDGTLAYYDHAACRQAICGRCTLTVNGRPLLACQTLAKGDITVDPRPRTEIVRDLVSARQSG